jgi:hypothetical protein
MRSNQHTHMIQALRVIVEALDNRNPSSKLSELVEIMENCFEVRDFSQKMEDLAGTAKKDYADSVGSNGSRSDLDTLREITIFRDYKKAIRVAEIEKSKIENMTVTELRLIIQTAAFAVIYFLTLPFSGESADSMARIYVESTPKFIENAAMIAEASYRQIEKNDKK